jgi:signal transduction histidine kinase
VTALARTRPTVPRRLLHLPSRTLRLRLTLLYGGLFLGCGVALLGINYVLVAHRFTGDFFLATNKSFVAAAGIASGGGTVSITQKVAPPGATPTIIKTLTPDQLLAEAHAQSTAALHQVLVQSSIALAMMAVISIWLGWLVAGRALRPIRTITEAAREISASSLDRRLALAGPDDELTRLASTFDQLIERLEVSFDAQRQFVANASHELRTPLTLERALVEVALADPDPSVESLRQMGEQVLAAGEQQERLIEALLTLSRSQRGLDRHERVDLTAAADQALHTLENSDLTVSTTLEPASTSGDPRLVERLVANLVANAVRHNTPGGRIEITTETREGRALFTIDNTGPVIPPGDLNRLFEPFQRLDAERTDASTGVGLGLSIVRAVAAAHRATIVARARSEGGLHVEVGFPALETT